MRTLPLLLIAGLLAGCPDPGDDDDVSGDDDATGDDDTTGDDDDSWAEVGTFIEEQMEAGAIAGLGAALVVDGQVAWADGFGWANIEQELPATADTPFMLASVSKTVTAVAVMQAVEDGSFSLDDDVNAPLPFTVDNPRVEGETIRVEHLVTHTSGIRDNWNQMPYFDGDSPVSLGDFVEGYFTPGGDFYHETYNFSTNMPGENWDYCNVATALAGYLVEATGDPFDDHCDDRIFEPLGMANTGWHLADFDPDQVAMPYEATGGGFEPYGHYGYPDYPDGQLRASAADLGRFLAAVSGGGALDGARILEEGYVDDLLSAPVPEVDPSQYVYWYATTIAGRSVVGHNGGDAGVATEMYVDPASGVGVVVLTNVDWATPMESAVESIEDRLFDVGEEMAAR